MKYSTKLSDAIHLIVFIYLNPKGDLSSASIAESILTNPAYVRQLMSGLKKAGIMNNTQGKAAASLARDISEISLYDVYHAVEGEKPLLHLDTHTNPDCGVGINIQLAIGELYNEIQVTVEHQMKQMTIQHVLEKYKKKIEKYQFNTFDRRLD